MTAKDKAKELFKKYSKGKDEYGQALCEFDSCAKICTLIAVEEILDSYTEEKSNGFIISDKIIPYWEEVKQEIINL